MGLAAEHAASCSCRPPCLSLSFKTSDNASEWNQAADSTLVGIKAVPFKECGVARQLQLSVQTSPHPSRATMREGMP